MEKILLGLIGETWHLLLEMAPYLLFGFFVAGVLHLLLPKNKVSKHLAKGDTKSVVKAALLGIPLPLCSCGVIPVAAHLKKQGANKGPLQSFLVSTPTTGVDSILATYSLLGILFAVVRPVAALFSGLMAGIIANNSTKSAPVQQVRTFECPICPDKTPHTHSWREKIVHMFRYAFFELIEDIGTWIVLGIVIGGVISYFVPAEFIHKYLGNPFLAYPLMLLIGIPMYVCATGSIPMVAPLILKGMTPGAGLVFLFAGPATNTATLSFVAGEMGRKSLITYLASIVAGSLIFGLLIDLIWSMSGQDVRLISGGMQMLPDWIHISSAIFLSILILRTFMKKSAQKVSGEGMLITVPDMSCEHCKRTLDTAIRGVAGVNNVNIDLKTKQIEVVGQAERSNIFLVIKDAGYTVQHDE
ncbi:MAG: hypothetical protein AMJ53_00310 [Gammaproteobacteria bacterium SG8_11]|nr:MAG: hypothetical protein AMJ53_00310 [Gammaproteobacteria bacterium SG8_11]